MARKPNYRFERQERDRRKAEKKAAKLKAKAEASQESSPDETEPSQPWPGDGAGLQANEDSDS